jgi:hypothetical protein
VTTRHAWRPATRPPHAVPDRYFASKAKAVHRTCKGYGDHMEIFICVYAGRALTLWVRPYLHSDTEVGGSAQIG